MQDPRLAFARSAPLRGLGCRRSLLSLAPGIGANTAIFSFVQRLAAADAAGRRSAAPGRAFHGRDVELSINRDLTLTFQTLADQVNGSLAQDRLVAMLSRFFGVLALLLAGLGLDGVVA